MEYLIAVTSHKWMRYEAIIQQLVCNRYYYSMLIPRDPLIPPIGRTREQISDTAKLKNTSLPLFFIGQRGDVARRSWLWNATSPDPSCTDRSNLSSVYHRNKSMGSNKEKSSCHAKRREEKRRKKQRKRKSENIKEEIILSRHWKGLL